ncbi:MAG TPA: mechanosensitive ion channel domain-containing protein [Thiobacillaceae bacterium]|nr:mechanosensitive ion channel domain-containing protein [Thiobacillaceae bacterium]
MAVLVSATLAQAEDITPAVVRPADAVAADQTFPVQASPSKAGLDLAARELAPTVGNWAVHDAAPGITWLQILLAGVALLAATLLERSLHALMRRQIRRREADLDRRQSWFKPTVDAMLAPLALLIWVWGSYSALAILLADLAGTSAMVQTALVWLLEIGNFAALFWFIFRLADVVEAQLEQWAAKGQSKWDEVLAVVAGRAMRWITPVVGVILLLPMLGVSAGSQESLNQATGVLLILAIGFILAQLVDAVEEGVTRQFRVDVKDNLGARKVRTEVMVLKKVALVVIGVFTVALALMTFPSVRHVGTSILASAGIAGIIIGFAAQRSLGTLVAGLQIALTQPIRIDDVVIVDDEWGRVEEITLTYVVVRIWDLRRLVVPVGYFLEKPFQNWTRVSADLLGTVMLYVDYTVPLKAMRDELDRILGQSPLWDGKVKVLQVTDAKERTLELRALVSAADASAAWDLRCLVREALVDFLQRSYPQCLPRMRAEVATSIAAEASAADQVQARAYEGARPRGTIGAGRS